MEEIIVGLVEKWPLLVGFFTVVGVLRAINKPLFSLLRAFVEATPSEKDDLVLDSVEGSKAYKSITYVLDWLFSVKLPKK